MKVELSTPVKLAALVVGVLLFAVIARREGPAARRYLKIETM